MGQDINLGFLTELTLGLREREIARENFTETMGFTTLGFLSSTTTYTKLT